MVGFAAPWGLVLLPLALWPLLRHGQQAVPYPSLALVPRDGVSDGVDGLLRLVAAACVIALVLGVSGLFLAAQSVQRIGQGAQTVMLLDSSGSMDTPFVTGNEHRSRVSKWGTYTSTGPDRAAHARRVRRTAATGHVCAVRVQRQPDSGAGID